MTRLNAEPAPTMGAEADRLTLHLHHCDLARGRWAALGSAAEALRTLLFGHVVTSAVLVVGVVLGLSWAWGWLPA